MKIFVRKARLQMVGNDTLCCKIWPFFFQPKSQWFSFLRTTLYFNARRLGSDKRVCNKNVTNPSSSERFYKQIAKSHVCVLVIGVFLPTTNLELYPCWIKFVTRPWKKTTKFENKNAELRQSVIHALHLKLFTFAYIVSLVRKKAS